MILPLMTLLTLPSTPDLLSAIQHHPQQFQLDNGPAAWSMWTAANPQCAEQQMGVAQALLKRYNSLIQSLSTSQASTVVFQHRVLTGLVSRDLDFSGCWNTMVGTFPWVGEVHRQGMDMVAWLRSKRPVPSLQENPLGQVCMVNFQFSCPLNWWPAPLHEGSFCYCNEPKLGTFYGVIQSMIPSLK